MKVNIGVIGLGYVGLPLSVEFGKHFHTIGYDINKSRISDLKNKIDKNLELSRNDFRKSKKLLFTSNLIDLENCNIFIVAVPTPKNIKKEPNLNPLKKVSKQVASILKYNDIVIYESTVYPGVTEETCVPILEQYSGLKYLTLDKKNKGFYCGYSPERINPGDKKNHFTKIVKIISGSTPKTVKKIKSIYSKIISAGTFTVSSIRAAEAVKVVENVQRDINIGLMNELAIIFNKLNLNIDEILNAAETKWNFSSFRPGLVGGHCIGVDPYYLIHKSTKEGYRPKFIEAARALNDNMAIYVADQTVKLTKNKDKSKLNILIMGLAYKENTPDIRNSLVYEIYSYLKKKYNSKVNIYDPIVDKRDALNEYRLKLLENIDNKKFDAIIFAVSHDHFKKIGIKKIRKFLKKDGVLYDVKHTFSSNDTEGRL